MTTTELPETSTPAPSAPRPTPTPATPTSAATPSSPDPARTATTPSALRAPTPSSPTAPTAPGASAQAAPRRRAKGEARRDALVAAAAAIIRAEGPAAVTHRAVAARAGVPLAATTYYFSSLEEILEAGGAVLAESWATSIQDVLMDTEAVAAATTPLRRADLIARALLPDGDDVVVRSHYEQLIGAGRTPALARSYASGRHRFDAAITDLLRAMRTDQPPATVLAVVDGGAVAALSEGRPVRPYVTALLVRIIG